MALNALVDSFCHNQKNVGLKMVKIKVSTKFVNSDQLGLHREQISKV